MAAALGLLVYVEAGASLRETAAYPTFCSKSCLKKKKNSPHFTLKMRARVQMRIRVLTQYSAHVASVSNNSSDCGRCSDYSAL